jgi:hypothetical protein
LEADLGAFHSRCTCRPPDQIDTWDLEKLEKVVNEKHHEKNVKQTEIVCKHFLDAIEKSLYGWFWVCPNGGPACKCVSRSLGENFPRWCR